MESSSDPPPGSLTITLLPRRPKGMEQFLTAPRRAGAAPDREAQMHAAAAPPSLASHLAAALRVLAALWPFLLPLAPAAASGDAARSAAKTPESFVRDYLREVRAALAAGAGSNLPVLDVVESRHLASATLIASLNRRLDWQNLPAADRDRLTRAAEGWFTRALARSLAGVHDDFAVSEIDIDEAPDALEEYMDAPMARLQCAAGRLAMIDARLDLAQKRLKLSQAARRLARQRRNTVAGEIALLKLGFTHQGAKMLADLAGDGRALSDAQMSRLTAAIDRRIAELKMQAELLPARLAPADRCRIHTFLAKTGLAKMGGAKAGKAVLYLQVIHDSGATRILTVWNPALHRATLTSRLRGARTADEAVRNPGRVAGLGDLAGAARRCETPGRRRPAP